MIRVLIVDDIPSTLENLQKLLSFEDDIEVCGTAADGKKAIEETRRLSPDVVLMDVNMPVLDGIQATEILAQEVAGSPVIIMSVQGERDYLRRAMQAGAREFLIKPFSGDELIAAIRRVHQLEQKKESYLAKAPAATAGAPAPVRTERGEMFVVFSGKGGIGKSVVSANLAVALAMETGARVALVDLDLQFGDVGVLLNLDHSRSITDLTDQPGRIDAEFVQDVLASGPEGVKVLLAPISPELADLVTSDHLRAIMEELRRSFDFIVIDTASHLTELNLEVIEQASRVIVMSALTIPAIKDTKLTLKVLDSLSLEPERILLLLNRSDAHSDFNKEAVEQNLRFPISLQLPHDPKIVAASVNRGAPFVSTNPEVEISRAMRELVSRLVPLEQSAVAVAAGAGGGADRKRGRRFGFGRG
ncbi:MAG TPA: response regulator [Candidatus Dormibacteraeota bacterium]|jgi:pilus assembly protein CpaE|nr:response regulator [Candidatus Dormibacteraeota bacterium]